MGSCKDCKHWGNGWIHGSPLGRAVDGRKGCSRISDDYKPPPETKAILEGIGYGAEGALLWTREDFGCSLFEGTIVASS